MNAAAPTVVRAATMDDLDAMLEVELRAFADVYGANPGRDLIDALRSVWAGRLEFLGSWARVLETRDDGIIGLLMCWPADPERLADLCQLFDLEPDGPLRTVMVEPGSAYILNLAVADGKARPTGVLRLFADLGVLAHRSGVRRLYSTSRIPGFAAWFADRFPGTDPDMLAAGRRLVLAEEYVHATVAGDPSRPLDPLVRMNMDSGGRALGVITGWSVDRPSMGFGVLFCHELAIQRRTQG